MCHGFTKRKENTKQAASITSVAYRNTKHMGTESDLKLAEIAICDNICYEHINRDVILCENESYGRVLREEGEEK